MARSSFFLVIATFATILSAALPATAFVGPQTRRTSLLATPITSPLFSPLRAAEPSIDSFERETLEDDIQAQTKNGFPLKLPPKSPPKDDNILLHLGCLLGGTIWWYVWNSYELFTTTSDFLGLGGTMIYDGMASYVTISQIIVLGVMWKLANAQTLRGAQGWILACICLCVPADSMIVFLNACGSKLTTVLAFAFVTMCFGVFLAHYLRIASQREEYNNFLTSSNLMTTSDEKSGDATSDFPEENMMALSSADATIDVAAIAAEGEGHHHHREYDNVFQELANYKPPENLQATHMAVAFTRSFVAFTVALAAVRDSIGGEHGYSFWLVASCVSVVVHTAIEMFITTLTPGVDLEEYPEFLTFEAILFSVHMLASSYIAHESPLGDSIWDELTYSWLFGNAAAEFTKRIELLARDVNYDEKLGLSGQES